MLEVRLVIDAPQEWIKALSQNRSALVKITDIKSSQGSPNVVQNFVEVSSSRTYARDLIDTISDSKNIRDSDLVQLDHHRIKGMVTSFDCPVCSTLAGLSCSLLSAVTREDHKMEWKILISGEDTLMKISDRLSSKSVNYEILEISNLSSTSDLTSRQEQIAKIALELGYFEFPKKIGIEELSKRLGISAGNLSEILRRAEKNILSKYFEEHRHG
jgi:predicted DNA binding protein